MDIVSHCGLKDEKAQNWREPVRLQVAAVKSHTLRLLKSGLRKTRVNNLKRVRWFSRRLCSSAPLLLRKSSRDMDEGVNSLFFGFSACFAVGIWLVFNRYQSVRNRAVPFTWPAPDVSFRTC